MPRRSIDSLDPLSLAIAPPPDETPEQQAERLSKEEEAKRVSNEIDEGLKVDAVIFRKNKKFVKLLLLGQSESGKSTTLKNFQLTYARKAWVEERASWRAVVQLNLVCSINAILRVISAEMAGARADEISGQLTDTHQLLKLRLAPLRQVELELRRRLAIQELPSPTPNNPTPSLLDELKPSLSSARCRSQEIYVRDPNSWKQLAKGPNSLRPPRKEDQDEVGDIISVCKDDMKSLWNDPVVRQLFDKGVIKLQESAEFFLGDIERIAVRDYSPTDNDVLRARLRTLGVQEYRISLEEKGPDWFIYDVGGSQTQRAAWLPYFEECNAIIFLAPISCFDEYLVENAAVNRLEDSFQIWRLICGSPLLSRVILIIFLNKMDILVRKLASGIKINRYLSTYGSRENEANVFANYLREQFRDILRKNSRVIRPFYGYSTSVVDTEATRKTIKSVREGVLRESLRKAELL